MAPLRTYLIPALAAVATVRAVELAEFVPECAPACIYEAVDTHSTCEPEDNACLCRDIYSLKRHSERCLEDSCTEAEYGESMLGYDNFCEAVESEPEPEPTVTTSTSTSASSVTSTEGEEPTSPPPPPPPSTTETSTETSAETSVAPPPETTSSSAEESVTTVPDEDEPTVVPTDNPEATNTQPEISTSMTFPTVSDLPTISTSVSINGTVTTGTEPAPTTTDGGEGGDGGDDGETTPPSAAGQFGVSFGVLAGGLLMAAFFKL